MRMLALAVGVGRPGRPGRARGAGAVREQLTVAGGVADAQLKLQCHKKEDAAGSSEGGLVRRLLQGCLCPLGMNSRLCFSSRCVSKKRRRKRAVVRRALLETKMWSKQTRAANKDVVKADSAELADRDADQDVVNAGSAQPAEQVKTAEPALADHRPPLPSLQEIRARIKRKKQLAELQDDGIAGDGAARGSDEPPAREAPPPPKRRRCVLLPKPKSPAHAPAPDSPPVPEWTPELRAKSKRVLLPGKAMPAGLFPKWPGPSARPQAPPPQLQEAPQQAPQAQQQAPKAQAAQQAPQAQEASQQAPRAQEASEQAPQAQAAQQAPQAQEARKEETETDSQVPKSTGFQGGYGSSSLKECIELLNTTTKIAPAPLDSGVGNSADPQPTQQASSASTVEPPDECKVRTHLTFDCLQVLPKQSPISLLVCDYQRSC